MCFYNLWFVSFLPDLHSLCLWLSLVHWIVYIPSHCSEPYHNALAWRPRPLLSGAPVFFCLVSTRVQASFWTLKERSSCENWKDECDIVSSAVDKHATHFTFRGWFDRKRTLIRFTSLGMLGRVSREPMSKEKPNGSTTMRCAGSKKLNNLEMSLL